jgi:hypothetical protein
MCRYSLYPIADVDPDPGGKLLSNFEKSKRKHPKKIIFSHFFSGEKNTTLPAVQNSLK